MKESMLRKLVLLLLFSTIVCLFWAAGANSRKRVELEKSKELNEKLEKLTLANTVITNNLRTIQNKIASLQQKEYELKNNLKQEEDKKAELLSTLQVTKEGHEQSSKALEELQNTNTTLGEELTRLKEQDLTQKQEIDELKKNLDMNMIKKKPDPEPEIKEPLKSTPKEASSGNNFAW